MGIRPKMEKRALPAASGLKTVSILGFALLRSRTLVLKG